jgi:hypothetical protein
MKTSGRLIPCQKAEGFKYRLIAGIRFVKQTIIFLSFLVISIVGASAQDSAPAKKSPSTKPASRDIQHLSDVHRIFIAELNRSEFAEVFRTLLSEKLTGKGFIVVQAAENADATLIGNLTVDDEQGRNQVKASAMLFGGPAAELWEGKSNLKQTGSVEENLAATAADLAERFSLAWKKNAKKRGVKVVE